MEALSKENRGYFMGIAMILVILHHLCLRLEDAWHLDSFPFSIFYWGQIGVDIFFFVSAYGCCASWEKNSWWRYLLRRIKRIYPQYILFLLIVLAWFYADSSVLHRIKMAVVSLVGIAPVYRMGVNIEWYIPSLLMMYIFLPLAFMGLSHAHKSGQVLILLALVLFSPLLLKYIPIYYAFVARWPVILCGVIAYLNRKDMSFLVRLFAVVMLLSLTTREEMMIHSLMIPLLLTALSFIELKNLPLEKAFSFCGKHSLEIFLAQTITTQYVMKHYYWGEKWLSLLIIIGITVVIASLFWSVQYGFSRLEKRFNGH